MTDLGLKDLGFWVLVVLPLIGLDVVATWRRTAQLWPLPPTPASAVRAPDVPGRRILLD